MSRARPVIAGSTVFITRRTLRRHLLLRPDREVRQLFVYALAIAAARYGLQVHSFCVMSTHYHLVATDPRGVLPEFLAHLHRSMALGLKVLRKWEGAAWDDAQTSVVQLKTPEAILDKIGYTLANPVAAGLVRYAREWPGAKSRVADLAGGRMRAARPDYYFDPENEDWPDYAELELTLPPNVAPEDAEAWRDAARASVTEHETLARQEVADKGWKFLGAERAEKVSPYDRAKSFEPLVSRNPTFAVGGVPGAYKAAIKALREFAAAYDAALEKWCAGVRDAVFPAGTWWMVRHHGAAVAT
jgi:REP element-mobilizing transposase RayT